MYSRNVYNVMRKFAYGDSEEQAARALLNAQDYEDAERDAEKAFQGYSDGGESARRFAESVGKGKNPVFDILSRTAPEAAAALFDKNPYLAASVKDPASMTTAALIDESQTRRNNLRDRENVISEMIRGRDARDAKIAALAAEIAAMKKQDKHNKGVAQKMYKGYLDLLDKRDAEIAELKKQDAHNKGVAQKQYKGYIGHIDEQDKEIERLKKWNIPELWNKYKEDVAYGGAGLGLGAGIGALVSKRNRILGALLGGALGIGGGLGTKYLVDNYGDQVKGLFSKKKSDA